MRYIFVMIAQNDISNIFLYARNSFVKNKLRGHKPNPIEGKKTRKKKTFILQNNFIPIALNIVILYRFKNQYDRKCIMVLMRDGSIGHNGPTKTTLMR